MFSVLSMAQKDLVHYEVNGVLVAAELLVTPVASHPEGFGATKSTFAMVIVDIDVVAFVELPVGSWIDQQDFVLNSCVHLKI